MQILHMPLVGVFRRLWRITDRRPHQQNEAQTMGSEPQTDSTTIDTEPTADMTSQTSGQETETGLDQNVAGALAYVLGPITGILFYVLEPDNRFVRFHAGQSIVLSIGVFVLVVVFSVVQLSVGLVAGDIPVLGFLLSIGFSLLWLVFMGAVAVVYLFLIYTAFRSNETKLPVIGTFVTENMI